MKFFENFASLFSIVISSGVTLIVNVISACCSIHCKMERTPFCRKHENLLTPRRARLGPSEKPSAPNTPKKTNTPLNEINVNYAKKHTKNIISDTLCHKDVESQNIRVSVRVKPPASVDDKDNMYLSQSSDNQLLVKCNAGKDENYMAFSYDHVFWFENGTSQSEIFREIGIPLIDSSLEGYNGCLFAYGQTGSGKTYSLMDADGYFTESGMGVTPRFCKELLNRKEQLKNEFTVHVSYYEIYHEKIYDLLADESNTEARTSLRVREHPLLGPYVSGSTSECINTFSQVISLLSKGNKRRMTGATLNNERSSRSHTIFDISIQRTTHDQTKVRLVDLAGSERVSQCAVTEERFKEGLSINKSLLILGKVITALAEKKKKSYIPYRESLLTWLLRDSLGGSSRTCMLATVSPSRAAVDETLSTLRWAHKAQSIICVPTKNEDPQIRLIVELQDEVKRLRSLRNGISSNGMSDSMTEFETLQATLELERRQRSAEMKLQAELVKLEMHLSQAEKRKCELEIQREVILQEASENSIPSYNSDFYDNLRNILDCSMNDSVGDIMKDDINNKSRSRSELKEKYIQKMFDLTECLESVYRAEVAVDPNAHTSKSALAIMDDIKTKLSKVSELTL